MMETWKPIPNYEGLYEVSDNGNLRSYYKPGPTRKDSISNIPNKCVYGKHGNGYVVVTLRKFGAVNRIRMHRLVLMAFRGQAPMCHEGAHLNGNKRDNRLSNLAWATKSENKFHDRLNGVMPLGESHKMSKLRNGDVLKIRRLSGKLSQQALGKMFGVSQTMVGRVLRNKNWRHLTGGKSK